MRLIRHKCGWEVQQSGVTLMRDPSRERAEMWMICHEDDCAADVDPIERSMNMVNIRLAMGDIDILETLCHIQGKLLKQTRA